MGWIIGIDLGTTHCTLSCLPKSKEGSAWIETCPIFQKIAPQLEGEQFLLASYYYFPLSSEKEKPCVGAYAKERGQEVPDRVVSSAKSWLCHPGVDHRKAFLPISDSEEKISPLDVCKALLIQIKEAWNRLHPQDLFDSQTILVTVPASFDPGARQLVHEAAKMASYPEITLMEEPLAAFYAWLNAHEQSWRKQLSIGDTILIVDIGGGTTDFSLIQVEQRDGELELNRKAVGEHLLLGGENLDLALAHALEPLFELTLDEWQFQSLIHACRKAKEALFTDMNLPSVSVNIPGRGSRLIGGALTATLTREFANQVLLEGFFPLVDEIEKVNEQKRVGITQLGLSYARDPRISAHLAHFLRQSGCSKPTAVLFNGGTMKSSLFRQRLLTLLKQWNSGVDVRELPEANYDFGVSRGAAYYGWVRQGSGIRVKAGTSRSYFLGVEGSLPAVPGLPPSLKAICLVPLGMEEGNEVVLPKETFSLVVGAPAVFRFFSLTGQHISSGEIPHVGMVIKRWQDELQELPSIETTLQSHMDGGQCVEVRIKAKITEMGVLELWCESLDGQQWKLEFDTRNLSV